MQFQFVANQWRKFLPAITDSFEPCTGICDPTADAFNVSAVGVEENGVSNDVTTIPYVLPPGTSRQSDYASQNKRRLNEQSLQLCVDNLVEGFGKAVYKNVTMDMLIYKRLKMFVHAQSQNAQLQDGQLRAFVRIGTDYTQNFYEYSVPLKITRQGTVDARGIWPLENEIDVAFEDFRLAKSERNIAKFDRFTPYSKDIGTAGNALPLWATRISALCKA